DELGFAGTVVTDALEMRALAGTLGMERGFAAALAAGADAIETGAQDYPDLVSAIPDAVERALDEGTLLLERLQDAATRTAEPAAGRPAAGADVLTHGQLDAIAARCLEVIGAIPRLERPLVVEARPPGGMASGELPWSLAEPLARRMSGVTALGVCAGE